MSYQSDHLFQRLKGQREFIVLLATRMREEPDKEIVAMLDRFFTTSAWSDTGIRRGELSWTRLPRQTTYIQSCGILCANKGGMLILNDDNLLSV